MIVRTAKQHDAQTLYLLQSVPGIGKTVRLVLLYEIHDITRFPRAQDFVSYCRLVKGAVALLLRLERGAHRLFLKPNRGHHIPSPPEAFPMKVSLSPTQL